MLQLFGSSIWAVALNLLASFIFAGAIAAFSVFRQLSKHRRIWKFKGPTSSTINLVAGTYDSPMTELGYRRATTAVSDAVSIGYLSQSLALGYRSKYRIIPMCSASFSDSVWNETVVLIGGRVRNSATRDLLRRAEAAFDMRLRIEDEQPSIGRHISDTYTGRKYEASIADDRITQDYGVIYRMRSPIRPHDPNPIFIFYGLHAHGTLGVAKIMAPEYTRLLRRTKDLRRMNEFQVLIRVDVANEEVFPHVVSVHPILARAEE